MTIEKSLARIVTPEFIEGWNRAEAEHTARLSDPGQPSETAYEVTFITLGGKYKTFYRTAPTQERAVREAQDGFQWVYGIWPGEPHSVVAP